VEWIIEAGVFIEKRIVGWYSEVMNKKAILIVIIFIAGLAIGGYKLLSVRSLSNSGIKIASVPAASVFLNDKLVGKTPFEEKYPPGKYVVKLIPEDTSANYSSWQGEVTLNSSLLTYLKRELGPSELLSGGEILTLSKISSATEAQIDVSSQPDGARVIFDGQEKGMSPVLIREVSQGEHDVSVSSPGFVSRTLRAQVTLGYKLNAAFQLALLPSQPATDSGEVTTPTPTPKEKSSQEKTEVTIKDTPTGFLRVRSGPGRNASEVAQVKPKEKYTLLDEQSGWYKIAYEEGKEGWISSAYAEKTN